MKLGARPENPVEMVLAAADLLPQPLLDTHLAMLLARVVMEGARLGVFEACGEGERTAEEIAAECDTHLDATGKLLDALVGAGYLLRRNGRYGLTRLARRWLLPASPRSLHDKMIWQLTEWDWLGELGAFVRSGEPVRCHHSLSPEQWREYQGGMRSLARLAAPEVARRTPVPRGARRMLDVGGAHGVYSAALCRRHPRLSAVVLDLPEALEHAAPFHAEEGLGERLAQRAGDVLAEDLGEAEWDLIFVANLVHHFDAETNRNLTRQAARALRPGGVLVYQELVRPHSPKGTGQIGALLGLYFAFTSRSGTWSFEEMAAWQREAGLSPKRPLSLLSSPGSGQQSAVKKARAT